PSSSDPPASASQSVGITGVHHRTQPGSGFQWPGRVSQERKKKFPRATAIKVTDMSGGTTRRNQTDACIMDIYLCPQTPTMPWLHRCCCLRPWMNLTDTILP
uniref:Uncharacterized protein n=1 Tax=Theropithecus gelada TaxID=9565 RepID=A0A8D2K6P6_THEGE